MVDLKRVFTPVTEDEALEHLVEFRETMPSKRYPHHQGLLPPQWRGLVDLEGLRDGGVRIIGTFRQGKCTRKKINGKEVKRDIQDAYRGGGYSLLRIYLKK